MKLECNEARIRLLSGRVVQVKGGTGTELNLLDGWIFPEDPQGGKDPVTGNLVAAHLIRKRRDDPSVAVVLRVVQLPVQPVQADQKRLHRLDQIGKDDLTEGSQLGCRVAALVDQLHLLQNRALPAFPGTEQQKFDFGALLFPVALDFTLNGRRCVGSFRLALTNTHYDLETPRLDGLLDL